MRFSFRTLAIVFTVVIIATYFLTLPDPFRMLAELRVGCYPNGNSYEIILDDQFDVSNVKKVVNTTNRLKLPCHVTIYSAEFDDESVTHFEYARNVNEITLVCLPITNDGFKQLKDIRYLKRIWLNGCHQIDKTGIADLQKTRPDIVIEL